MGLDKLKKKWLDKIVRIKLLLDRLGLGLKGFLNGRGKARVSPFEKERQKFEEDVREQFVKLKEKGINIPVFTL